MQFDNQTTRNVADIVARILAGESAQQEPKMLEEELVGNQHKIDANKNNKIDAHDFKLLRKKKKVEEETEEIDETNHARSATKSEYQKSLKTLEKMPEFGAMSKSLKRRDQDAEYDKRKQDEFKKSLKKEETELTESHFKVGDEVICKASGMEGEVVKIDEPQTGKYYTVKQENGKMVKYAPNELKKEEEEDEDEEDDEDENKMKSEEVHNKKKDDTPSTSNSVKKPVRNSDGTIQSPISRARELAKRGLKKAMSKEEVEELDEAMFPGTKEYEKKYGQSPQQKLRKKGDTVPTSQGDMTKTDKGIAHRRRFTEMLESYTEGGLKYIASLVQEEPDNEEFTKEVEEVKRKATQKKSPEDEARVAKASVQAVKNEEVEELDETNENDAKRREYYAKLGGGPGSKKSGGKAVQRGHQKSNASQEKPTPPNSTVERKSAIVQKLIASHRQARDKHDNKSGELNRIPQARKTKEQEKQQHQHAMVSDYHNDAVKDLNHHEKTGSEDSLKSYKKQVRKIGLYTRKNPHLKEDTEELDELSNKTLTDFETRARFSSDPKHREGAQQARKKISGMSDRLRQGKLNNPMMKSKPSMSNEETEIQVINADIANGVQFDNIEERSLTEPEMKKKEEIVMSMKKGMEGFKARYGDRAKQVVYATATRMAKEKA